MILVYYLVIYLVICLIWLFINHILFDYIHMYEKTLRRVGPPYSGVLHPLIQPNSNEIYFKSKVMS